MDVLLALALIGVALFAGAILLRRAPTGLMVFGLLVVAFGLGIPALVIDDNTTDEPTADETAAEAPAEGEAAAPEGDGQAQDEGATAAAEGRQIFVQSCGTCHTISDAGTSGTIGPNLDELAPDSDRVLAAIENGGTGSGAMPANIVTGDEAEAVSDYVAEATGR